MPRNTRQVLNQALRDKLRQRIRIKQKGRAGGSRPELQRVIDQFNNDTDGKAELMQEIAEDLQGGKGKKPSKKQTAKQLRSITKMMNKEQNQQFVKMAKRSLPSQYHENLNTFTSRENKASSSGSSSKRTDSSPLSVNPETVYRPTSTLTTDEKLQVQAKQRAEAAPQKTKKKKKKFSPINVYVPKNLREITQTNNNENKSSSARTSTATKPVTRTRDDINSIFAEEEVHNVGRIKQLSCKQRSQNIRQFQPSKALIVMQSYLLEADHQVFTMRLLDTRNLPIREALILPPSVQTCHPDDLTAENRALADRVFPKWGYVVGQDTGYRKVNDEMYQQGRSVYVPCLHYSVKLCKVQRWVHSLKGRQLPWKWFIRYLASFGVMEKRREGRCLHLQLMCEEFDSAAGKVTVPMIPFMKLTFDQEVEQLP